MFKKVILCSQRSILIQVFFSLSIYTTYLGISIAGSTFTTNRDQEAYYNQPAEPEPVRNKPSRNYFPVNENYDDLDRNDFVEEELPNPFVGEEQQVNAG